MSISQFNTQTPKLQIEAAQRMCLLEMLLNLSGKALHSRLEPIDGRPKPLEFIMDLSRGIAGNVGLVHDAAAAVDIDAVGEIAFKILESVAGREQHTPGVFNLMLGIESNLTTGEGSPTIVVSDLPKPLHLYREALVLLSVFLERPRIRGILDVRSTLLTLLARED